MLNRHKSSTLKKRPLKWTKEKCAEEALKYETRNEFLKGKGTAYISARENNWLDDICVHMKQRVQKVKNYWNYETCKSEALKYSTRNEFCKNSGSAYTASIKLDFLDEICSHMVSLGKLSLWTKELCQKEALKYRIRRDFRRLSVTAFKAAYKNNWLDEICLHMINPLRKSQGYWTKERCAKEALKYSNKLEFRIKSGGAYNSSFKKQWLDELCSHMTNLRNSNGYWTKEKCHEHALKHNSRSEFQLKDSGAYQAANKNQWLNEVCSHMKPRKKPVNYWTKEVCHQVALSYKTKREFLSNDYYAYRAAYKKKWLDDICLHMIKITKSKEILIKKKDRLKDVSSSKLQV